MQCRIWSARGLLLSVLTVAGCAAPGPPPKELVNARLAVQDAKTANADQRATHMYDSAVAHLNAANESWEKHHDASAIAHPARLAEGEARKAQYAAEAQMAEETIRLETDRKNRNEVALRDAEIALLRTKEQNAELERLKTVASERELALLNAHDALAASQARAERAARLSTSLSNLATVREEARGIIVTLPGNIYFDFDSADVRPAMRERLTEIAKTLAAVPDQHFLIEGHTDSDGSIEYNLILSERRALSVRSILLAGGIAPERIETKGYGWSNPIAPNSTAAGKAQNRRVEIVLQTTK